MKRKKHSPEQIIKKLREADAMLAASKTIGQVCCQSALQSAPVIGALGPVNEWLNNPLNR